MKTKIDLGKNISVDLSTMIDTRLLIQANSGGGKSWAIRKLLESTHGKVQQIVLDIEGDFPSMREKFDFILAGKGGDIPANHRTAEILARKILELRSDIIIDLYELKQHERIRFVKLFLESMINAPKDLWHSVLVVVDEAHIFAPEKGQAESMGAVIDFCTRGRKRGFCAVLATQRLSKLHKDAAAECNNKLIGRTCLDIDLKRAGDEIGFISGKDSRTLRDLDPGQFYAFGPAISKAVVLGQIGSVLTSHPKAGSRSLGHTPAPTQKVKAALQKLTDLPKEAEEELTDRNEMRAKIKTLERALKSQPEQKIDRKMIDREIDIAIYKAKRTWSDETIKIIKIIGHTPAIGVGSVIEEAIKKIHGNGLAHPKFFGTENKKIYAPAHKSSAIRTNVSNQQKFVENTPKINFSTDLSFGRCESRILGFLKMKEGESFSKAQVGAMTGYSHGSGGFNNALSKLSQAGLIIKSGLILTLNPNANGQIDKIIGDATPHTLQDWIGKLGACEKKIYQILLENPECAFTKEDLGEKTGYSAGSGGFNNSLSRLNTLGLIKKQSGIISLNPEVRYL